MPKIKYQDLRFRGDTLEKIKAANVIIDEYTAQGYSLTLRQLYYQFVSRDLCPNTQKEYRRLSVIISNARRAGLVDWGAIVDHTRNLRKLSSWDSPKDIIESCAEQYIRDWWLKQNVYVEVWFEKDALMSVFQRAANELRIPFFSCRGYTSDSEVWGAAQRLRYKGRNKDVVILHFGDHDPSGIDMTRDIQDRLCLFGAPENTGVRRIALNMDQVRQYGPPPNPAKEADSRFADYYKLYGKDSWELDALDPTILGDLVRREAEGLIEVKPWNEEQRLEAQSRIELTKIAESYGAVVNLSNYKWIDMFAQ